MKYFLLGSFFIGLLSTLLGCSGSGTSAPQNTTAVETCFDVSVTRAGNRQTQNICTTRENGGSNKLGVARFIKFTLNTSSVVNIAATRTSGLDPADPDLVIYRAGEELFRADGTASNSETLNVNLAAGDYVVVIDEFNYFNLAKPQKNTQSVSLKKTQTNVSFTTSPSNCTTGNDSVVSGEVLFERVNHSGRALDYNNIVQQPVQQMMVEVICNGGAFSTTVTDIQGRYSLNFPNNQASFVRVSAHMLNGVAWDIRVVDNTNGDALYVMDGNPFTESSDQVRNLTALSGWGGTGYTRARTAAPFAILDSIRKAKDKVLSVVNVNLPPLQINWSPDNTMQLIETTFYENSQITLLGAENSDTDEYDEHVIIHEWGHYFEDILSRTDSIGGTHTTGDILDMRLAFSEGFGNAFSSMATDDPIYKDSSGRRQGAGFTIDMENNNCLNAGWYSECSVQSVMYDIYDATNEGGDTLALGFLPIYNVFVGAQKNTPALTSLFSFIKPLKDQNLTSANVIDSLLNNQRINSVIDIYGAGQITANPGATDQLPIYLSY